MSWECPVCNKQNNDKIIECNCGYKMNNNIKEQIKKPAKSHTHYIGTKCQEDFQVDRKGLGLFFRSTKLEKRCENFITSRVVEAEKNGFKASYSLLGFDPWHRLNADGSPHNCPDRLVLDTLNQFVKVFNVTKWKISEITFALTDVKELLVEVEPKNMIKYDSSSGKMVTAGALVGGATGVLTALVLNEILSLFRSAKVVNFSLTVRFCLLSGDEVPFEFMKEAGFVIQNQRELHGDHFKEFVGAIQGAESRCLKFLNRHFRNKRFVPKLTSCKRHQSG